MEEPLLSETAVASHDWTRDNIRMQEQPLHIGMRVIGFFISLGLLGLAGVISYSAPFTQSTLTRGEDGQIELRIQRYMLFFIPIGEEQINDVKDVELKHVPRSDAALIIRTADGNRHLRTTFFLGERSLRRFLEDHSLRSYAFRTFPNLFFVGPFGALGLFFVPLIIIGESLRFVRWLRS